MQCTMNTTMQQTSETDPLVLLRLKPAPKRLQDVGLLLLLFLLRSLRAGVDSGGYIFRAGSAGIRCLIFSRPSFRIPDASCLLVVG